MSYLILPPSRKECCGLGSFPFFAKKNLMILNPLQSDPSPSPSPVVRASQATIVSHRLVQHCRPTSPPPRRQPPPPTYAAQPPPPMVATSASTVRPNSASHLCRCHRGDHRCPPAPTDATIADARRTRHFVRFSCQRRTLFQPLPHLLLLLSSSASAATGGGCRRRLCCCLPYR